jgi:hypothetical protein
VEVAPKFVELRWRPDHIRLRCIEVYGPTKAGAAYNYQGQRTYRADIVLWAELGVPLAADLLAVWRAAAAVPGHEYVPVIGMDDTEVAVIPYAPKGWPKQIACLARRTRIRADQVSRDPRARKRRTIPADQLALALDGRVEYVYGYSFILTNKPVHTPDATLDGERLAEVEYWYRHRTYIESLNKDGKHGAALRHMPSADQTVNRVWMWAALLATAISAWIQELSGIDRGNGRGRRTIARLRRELINVPRQGHPPRPDHRPTPATRPEPARRRPAPSAGPADRLTTSSTVHTTRTHQGPWNPANPTRQPGRWNTRTRNPSPTRPNQSRKPAPHALLADLGLTNRGIVAARCPAVQAPSRPPPVPEPRECRCGC